MKNLNELPEILEVSDLMEFFGLSRAGTYRLVRKKGFPASLIKWLERQEREAEMS